MKDYKNNLNNIKDGRCVSYGAITGEETTLGFIRHGQLELPLGDIVAKYSDDFINLFYDTSFIKQLIDFKTDDFEKYVNQQARIDYNKYGKEKAIALLKFL